MLTTSTQSSILDLSKEVMMLKNKFNTSIDADILQAFKDKCKEDNLPISIVLERFMQGYVEGKFTFIMKYSDNGK